jgi:hypothetical protein
VTGRWWALAAAGVMIGCAGSAEAGESRQRLVPSVGRGPIVPPVELRQVAERPAAPRGARAGGTARRGNPPAEAATPAAAEAMFDRLVLEQARTALQLSAAQQRQFEPRMTRLQNVRRRLQRERQRLVNELAAATRDSGSSDEASLRERLRALEAFRGRADERLREVVAAVDQVLSVEQQARFRVFERRMERLKLDLLARARREARTGEPGDAAAPVLEAP